MEPPTKEEMQQAVAFVKAKAEDDHEGVGVLLKYSDPLRMLNALTVLTKWSMDNNIFEGGQE